MKRICRQCSGTGWCTGYDRRERPCWNCDGAGFVVEWEQVDRCLSNSDSDSEPVRVSNLRVWADAHSETEGVLWRMVHGGYGSQWVEVREGLATIEQGDVKYKRAERLGLTGLTAIVDDLHRLEQYPVLDDDDMGEAEQEEQKEHWESYGRSDMKRAIRKASEDADGNEDEAVCARLDDLSAEDFDRLYWEVCHDAGWYPERIDSSAWDFGEQERWGRPAPVVGPMLAAVRSIDPKPPKE